MLIDVPIVTFFIDGLKPDSLKYMPFLNSLAYKRRMKTDLGYSITCHASMYSGVYPEKHKMWFLWKYSPQTSPFRFLENDRLNDFIDCLPSRYFIAKMLKLFSDSRSYGGLSVMKKSALRNWKYFDLSEHRFWTEDGYLEDRSTIFEILRENGIAFETVGLLDASHNGGSLEHTKNYNMPKRLPPWAYFFIGDVDHVSHLHTQESDEAVKVLKSVDACIESIYLKTKEVFKEEPIFFCFSDHGHMAIKTRFDIYDFFVEHKTDLNKYIHIIDTNYARFWFRNDEERKTVLRVLSDMPSGFILDADKLNKYHTKMPDNRYGDLIFYLDYPFMFKRSVWGYSTKTVSIHGYLPDYKEKDGVFISNQPVREGYIELVDIVPSLLRKLSIKVESEFDGKSIWS